MTTTKRPPSPEDLLERTLDAARRARVTPPGPAASQRLARTALERAHAKKARSRTLRTRALSAGAVAAALVLGAFIGMESTAPVPSDQTAEQTAAAPHAPEGDPALESVDTSLPSPTERIQAATPATTDPPAPSTQLVLASGDRLLSSPGSSFEVLSDEGDRVVDLESGDVLFDVVHRDGETFSVQVGDVRVEVLGTVFSVLRHGEHVAVRVFEGSVAVHASEGLEPRLVEVDETWMSGRLDGLDAWHERCEDQWLSVAPGGVREPERGAPVSPEAVRGTVAVDDVEPRSTLAEAQTLLATGDLEALLSLCERSDATGPWRLYRADALRGLRRLGAAAAEYERAAELLRGMQRLEAAFAAAQLYAEERPAHAVTLLRRYNIVSQRSALEERARSLEVRLLEQLGRTEELRSAQASYESRFGAELVTE